jgi:hypothetical protein
VKIYFLGIDHMGHQKIESLMLISKMLNYISDKIPPKKLKLKNENMGLCKMRKQLLFYFLGGHFVTKTSLLF